jgi:hypothetical protein
VLHQAADGFDGRSGEVGVRQVLQRLLSAFFTQVQFVNLTLDQIGDVVRRNLGAAMTFHTGFKPVEVARPGLPMAWTGIVEIC